LNCIYLFVDHFVFVFSLFLATSKIRINSSKFSFFQFLVHTKKRNLNFHSSLSFFLEQKFSALSHYSTRHSLYLLWRPEASGPPQQDAATVWAKFERLYFHNWV
jgi:hypothetical protein